MNKLKEGLSRQSGLSGNCKAFCKCEVVDANDRVMGKLGYGAAAVWSHVKNLFAKAFKNILLF
ncbi:hypothetical protein D3C71_1802710 [compost metagenome]